MSTVSQVLKGIGATLTYPVGPGDLGVSVSLIGPHQGYGLVIEGSTGTMVGPWVKQEILLPIPGGRHELAPGAFDVIIHNVSRFFAVDVVNPLKLKYLRVRLQQWFGNEHAALTVKAEGLKYTPKPEADTGTNLGFDQLKGQVIAVAPQTATASDASKQANLGGDYRQLMLGVNVTSLEGLEPDGDRPTWSLQTLGCDGIWYDVWTSEPREDVGQFYASIGVGLHINRMFGNVVRVAWTVPDGVTCGFSASLMGKTLPP